MIRMIPEAEIERVKRETDLLALVRSRGIELKAHGSKNWIGFCPFHKDKNKPNLIVTPSRRLFHCMACGAAGNAIQFVQRHDGVSFRHAFDVLASGHGAAYVLKPAAKISTVSVLPCPLDPQADDTTLFQQVVAYYQERIKKMTLGRDYLVSRGLAGEEMIDFFQMGLVDRTLGLRLPDSNRKEGEFLRRRLTELGVWRETGREHFNGCVVVPLRDPATGGMVSFYGRRYGHVIPGAPKHLYLPGSHRGLFNPGALDSPEIILCEAVLDALTFWVNGFRNVTSIFGTEGFTEELWGEILQKKVKRVRLAYDADEAGDRAAERDAKRLRDVGIEVYRVKFPWGMDANEYARKVTPAAKSLALLLNASVWVGGGKPPGSKFQACHPSVVVPSSELKTEATSEGATIFVENTHTCASSSLAADLAAKEEKTKEAIRQEEPVVEPKASPMEIAAEGKNNASESSTGTLSPLEAKPPSELEQRGDAWFMGIENRQYRVSGLEKTLGSDGLEITLRVHWQGCFHLDQMDLCRDNERRRFVERASEETNLSSELLKCDMGKILLAVERAQAELGKPVKTAVPRVILTPEEREEALEWLRQPDLVTRLKEAFRKCGIIGEETNALVAYLSGVSRKLEKPLAVIIQSASAAGKSTLMDAVLAMFPEEERVKYSAMTGQSLYYLGETNLKHKILAIVEEAGAEKASYALKLLQSEGELVIASTGKDPQSGKMVTHEYRVEGPVMIILTTTAINIDEELLNRCMVLTVNESAEQTALIHQAQREKRTLAGLVAREEQRDLLRKLRNAQRLLQPLQVINPFAPLLEFPADRTRTRRDNDKYLTLMDSNALLHQYQRPRGIHEMNGRRVEYIEVTLEDIALANQLVPEILGRSLDELPPQTRGMLDFIRKMAQEKHGARPYLFSRRALCETSGWSLSQVRLHLERLVEHEYLAVRHGRLGSPFLYELLIDADSPETAIHIRLIDIEKLRESAVTITNLAVLGGGVAEEKGNLAGGGKMNPPGCFTSEKAA